MSGRKVHTRARQSYGRVPLRIGSRRPEPKGVRLTPLQVRLILLIIALLVVGWGIYHYFTIRSIRVIASTRSADIQVAARKIVAASWQDHTLLTLDAEGLGSKLQQGDPSLRSVTIRRDWPHGLVISAIFKQPSLGWASGNQQFLLDRDGTAIGPLPIGAKVAVVNDSSNLPVQIGQRVTSTRFVSFAATVVPALEAKGIGVTSLVIQDTTVDLYVTTNKGYRIILDTTRAVSDEIADLTALQTLLNLQKKTPTEYIDLRIAGKAYYK